VTNGELLWGRADFLRIVMVRPYDNLGNVAADAHRGDEKCFGVRADEKLTAFVELKSAIRAAS
jgi:hypothetical protein